MHTAIFYALCDLANEGHTTVKNTIAAQVIEAAGLVFPEAVICGGIYNAADNSRVLYVDNYKQIK